MLFKLVYNCFLCLAACVSLPYFLWKNFRSKKKMHLWKKFTGCSLRDVPDLSSYTSVIWIHAVSMGETRAMAPLYRALKAECPNSAFVVSSVTHTGHEEAIRSLPEAQGYFFLPFDFSWNMSRCIKKIQPSLILLCEGDFWYNMLSTARSFGTPVCLINGKMSARSFSGFRKIPFFTHRLFSQLDFLFVQSQEYAERFLQLGIPTHRIEVTGNLKFDAQPAHLTQEQKESWVDRFALKPEDLVITAGSTHKGEEEEILSACSILWEKIPHLKLFLVPRHPERFSLVASMLATKKIPFGRYTSEQCNGNEKVILIDTMGQLTHCYDLSSLALVGGSFVEGIGGHNIFEPCLCQIPVIFGPYMHHQQELVKMILGSGAGLQVAAVDLAHTLLHLLTSQDLYTLQKHAVHLAQSVGGGPRKVLSTLRLRFPQARFFCPSK